MIPYTENYEEAVTHFSHNQGPALCCDRKREKECATIEEAKIFYAKRKKKVRNKVRPIKK
jgi:hypothetical protein